LSIVTENNSGTYANNGIVVLNQIVGKTYTSTLVTRKALYA
jgi:hypothetical protein